MFGATFAPKGDSEKGKNVSIHGCVQITHAIDRYEQGRIYSEQITSPFSDPKSKTDKDTKEVTKTDPSQTTIGNQSMLSEGHYVHHFSVNPKNIEDLVKKSKATPLSIGDIDILKQTMKTGVTYYDSSKKAGVDNELLLWVQLKAESKIVLPSFVEMVDVKDDAKRTIDLAKIKTLLAQATIATDIESIELYYDSATTVVNAPEKAVVKSLN